MKVNQIWQQTNEIFKEVTGQEPILTEDMRNLVDVGDVILTNDNFKDNYVKAIINRIARDIFVNREYRGKYPDVYRDSFEYGSVVAKYRMVMPQAEENESWNLVNGQIYEQDQAYIPEVSGKFFNKMTTWEIPISIAEFQLKESFLSAENMNRFYSMVRTQIDNAIEVRKSALVKRIINNMIAETIYQDYNGLTTNLSNGSGVKGVNLLYLYKQETGDTSVTTSNYLTHLEFLKFASYTIKKYMARVQEMSKLFNMGGTDKFTYRELMHVVLHSEFVASVDTYLQSDTFHNEFTALPYHDEVPLWQASGEKYESAKAIDVTTTSGNNVAVNNIIGVIFDHDALGINNDRERVTVHYNAKAEFYNNYYKIEARYFNDFDENFVVFFVA